MVIVLLYLFSKLPIIYVYCYIQAFFFISTQNEVGSTPLIGASENGHVSTCDFLIDHGAHVDLGMKVRLFY